MAGPPNPFAGLGQRGGTTGTVGRGRGGAPSCSTTHQAANGKGHRDTSKFRARGRGGRLNRGHSRGGAPAGNTWPKPESQTELIGAAASPFAQLKQNQSSSAPRGGSVSQQKSTFPDGRESFGSFGVASGFNGTTIDTSRDPRKQHFSNPINKTTGSGVNVEDASLLLSYNDRYEQLKLDRAKEREKAIKAGQMADPNQPISLNQAITPVGTCTSMCPEFERVERIVQKMVDKSEKFLHPSTNSLQNMEMKMLKRFRRSAAGYDEQLPSDIRTPKTLLQTMNYLVRHVLGGTEPLGLIHKFVWDRTRSIRNDFSVQQLTQEEDVKIAVTCLERIARFHIVSLHLLSSPANQEPFDRHQEREQLNNTMLSLMYYYDDNRDRVHFPNEDEFRAYYIIFSIHDQRPDLEARVQKWPAELRNSPRVQMALELLAAAGNTWEYQGTLDAKRPNAIAQGFYTRFFNLVDSPGVSYLMACVAEIYFNHVRQTAIRSIWKGYCRYPSSQQHKNEEWTVSELTTVLCFDNEDQTIEFCEEQDLGFAENAQGHRYLNWGSRPVDSVAFQPSSDHSFSERYVESKRAGRTLVAIILGLNIKEAATLGMIETYLLPQRIQPGTANDDSLFVSDDDNKVLPSSPQPNALLANGPATSDSPVSASSLDNSFNESSETPARDEMSIVTQAPKTSQPGESNLFSSIFSTATPKSVFPTPAAPSPFSGLTSVFTKPSETKSGSFSFSAPQTSQQPAPIFPAGQTPSTLLKDANKAPLFPSVAPSFGTQNPFSLDKTAFNSPFNNTTAPDNTTKPLLSVTAGQSPSGTFDGTKISTAPSRNTSTFNFPSQATGFGGMGAQQHQPTPLAFSLSNLGNTPAALSRLPSSSAPTEDEGKPAFSFSPAATTLSNLTPKTPAAASPSVSEAKPLENKHIDSDTHKVADTPALTQEHASSLNHNIIQRPESSSLSGSTSVKASDVSVASQPSTDSTSVDESFASLTEQTTSEDLPSTDVNDQRVQWIEALKEVAEKRRRTSSMSRKRAHDDPEEEQSAENGSKPPKASKPEVPTARPKSMALFSTKPLPKLPILEHIEALVSRKHSAEQFESPKPTQVDEDEILLSAARIAAETLRSGPKLLDSWSVPSEPRHSFSPHSSFSSSLSFSQSQSPQSSHVNGYDVALAPDTDFGLGRTMSRTEQRIRSTGGRGLAYKPLDFTPEKKRKSK